MAQSTYSAPQHLFNEGGFMKKLTLLLALAGPISAMVCPSIDTSPSVQTHLESIDVSVQVNQRPSVSTRGHSGWSLTFWPDMPCNDRINRIYHDDDNYETECLMLPIDQAYPKFSWSNNVGYERDWKLCFYTGPGCGTVLDNAPAQVAPYVCKDNPALPPRHYRVKRFANAC